MFVTYPTRPAPTERVTKLPKKLVSSCQFEKPIPLSSTDEEDVATVETENPDKVFSDIKKKEKLVEVAESSEK